MTDTHEGNDQAGAPTLHRGQLADCPAPECQDRVAEQQDDVPEPTATPAGQSIALHLTGYPYIPNRWGPGHIRPTGIRLDYGNQRTPDSRAAHVFGVWVREDGEVTDAPVDRDYYAPNGDLSNWPPEIADLAKKHQPDMQAEVEPGTCGHRSSEGHPCNEPHGHFGYHRNARQGGNEWTSWVGDTPLVHEPEGCGAEPPEGWPGDCWCTLTAGHEGPHRCEPCSNRHDAPGWSDEPAPSAGVQTDEETDADSVVAPHCDGFPTTCPNPVTVPPAPPHHGGGIRCGCYDDEVA
jgi:hypothetical protein